MNRKPVKLFLGIAALLLGVLACGLPLPTPVPLATADTAPLYTQAALTLVAQLTKAEIDAAATQVLQPPTDTPAAVVDTPVPLPTLAPPATSTPFPTASPLPTLTPIIIATATPEKPCNAARFVEDVSIPDGTRMSPGEAFVKIWELENVGTCTWSEDYELVFLRGDQMDGPDTMAIDQEVLPGDSIQIAVDLVAPTSSGEYQGNWLLSDEEGNTFGVGSSAKSSFWVKIEVREVKSGVVYDFVANYCSATWQSSARTLPCPGAGSEPSGFVRRLDRPEQENRTENEPALWTNPEMEDGGWITGTYPAVNVKSGDRFLADVGCLKDADKCDVLFRLDYKIGDGAVKNLGEWNEVYDGSITRIDVNLNSLAGKEVKFILTVTANGDYSEDEAFWLVPHIKR
jgi:hypothetical protein